MWNRVKSCGVCSPVVDLARILLRLSYLARVLASWLLVAGITTLMCACVNLSVCVCVLDWVWCTCPCRGGRLMPCAVRVPSSNNRRVYKYYMGLRPTQTSRSLLKFKRARQGLYKESQSDQHVLELGMEIFRSVIETWASGACFLRGGGGRGGRGVWGRISPLVWSGENRWMRGGLWGLAGVRTLGSSG